MNIMLCKVYWIYLVNLLRIRVNDFLMDKDVVRELSSVRV